jgi:hypothetical protein
MLKIKFPLPALFAATLLGGTALVGACSAPETQRTTIATETTRTPMPQPLSTVTTTEDEYAPAPRHTAWKHPHHVRSTKIVRVAEPHRESASSSTTTSTSYAPADSVTTTRKTTTSDTH